MAAGVDVHVVGGGLAGCEAAWQLAEAGLRVALVEMKPAVYSPAHQTPLLAELVCSNTFRSDDVTTGPGLLKDELRRAGSIVMRCADRHRVPAGAALGLERVGFARAVTLELACHPRVRIERRVIDELPAGPVIMATGPLTGGRLAREVQEVLGGDRLYFYDAIAPIVDAESIDFGIAFRQSRYDRDSGGEGEEGEAGDYVNCPMTREEYTAFVEAVRAARKVLPHSFEEPRFFEGCLPIEVMAERGDDVLAYGPMRPVGLTDPRSGRRPHAVVQLRPENEYRTAYNLVGFQTRMAYPEQQRVFRMIPGLGEAEFLRMGSIHRNSYVDSPRLLGPELELRTRPDLRFGGLLTGVEGYIESCAMGLLAALFLAGRARGEPVSPPPATTALGGLWRHVTAPRAASERYTPTNVNFGLLPPATIKGGKRDRRVAMAERAQRDLGDWLGSVLPGVAARDPKAAPPDRRPPRGPKKRRGRADNVGATPRDN